jgi:trans-2,3-dihydro-3-hydroxyanthranilate isomerase
MSHPFHTVDVFACAAYAGNPLAVVVDPGDLNDDQMLRIAREINYSETSFVRPRPGDDGGYPVRMFTPAKEIPFAGHPILGTAWVVRHHLAAGLPGTVQLNLAVGPTQVRFDTSAAAETAWFTAPPVQPGPTVAPGAVADALGIPLAELDTRTPIQCFTAGVSACLLPLRSLEALARVRIDRQAVEAMERMGLPRLLYFFCRKACHPENHLSARFFFFADGVREDPATGNAAAFLGVYLLEHLPAALAEPCLRIEQGHHLNRPSLVLLRAHATGDAPTVLVGGQVIPIIRGDLLPDGQVPVKPNPGARV